MTGGSCAIFDGYELASALIILKLRHFRNRRKPKWALQAHHESQARGGRCDDDDEGGGDLHREGDAGPLQPATHKVPGLDHALYVPVRATSSPL